MRYVLPLIVVLTVCTRCTAQEGTPPLPPELAARFGELLQQDWKERPEWADMAAVILKNEPMGYGKGWFTGAKARYGWAWLGERFPQAAADGKISNDEIELSDADFARLDRDGNGQLSAGDFDWSKGNPMMSGFSPSDMVFDRLDVDFNGRLSREEVLKFFDQAGGGFDFLTVEELRRGLGLRMPRMTGGGAGRGDRKPPDMRWLFMRRLLNGELGSLTHGPKLNDPAPEQNLPLLALNEDRSKMELTQRFVTLKEFRGKKPVVLIFGSFT